MLRVDIKLRLDFNQLPLKMQKRSFHVLLINKTRLKSTLNDNEKIVNIYIIYEIEKSVNISRDPTLENYFFGAVKLTKHIDIDRYKYSGYGIGFERKGFFSISDEVGKNVIIFGVDTSSSSHIDNKKKIF